MPATPHEVRQRLLAHYIRLAQTEGWGAYTRKRLEELAREDLFADLPQRVKEALAALQEPSLSTTHGEGKPSIADS